VFAKRLRQLREKAGISQIELGKIINISNTTLSMYESGNREPDFEILKKLADHFNVTTDYLLGRINHPKGFLLENYAEHLTPEELKAVKDEQAWMIVASELAARGITPDKIRDLVRTALDLK